MLSRTLVTAAVLFVVLAPFVAAGPIGFASFDFNATTANQTVKVYVATVSAPTSGRLSVQLPVGGCGHRAKVSETAEAVGCVFATNAGFFNMKTGMQTV